MFLKITIFQELCTTGVTFVWFILGVDTDMSLAHLGIQHSTAYNIISQTTVHWCVIKLIETCKLQDPLLKFLTNKCK